MRPRASSRFLASFALGVFAVAVFARAPQAAPKRPPAQLRNTSGNSSNPKIRAVTAFVNLDWRNYQRQIADTLNMLHRAQTIFESRGYQVQTIRIATQPFPEYIQGLNTEQSVARSEEHTSELQSLTNLVCRLLLEKKNKKATRGR